MEKESLNKTWFIDIDGTIVRHLSNVELDKVIHEMEDRSYLSEDPIPQSLDFINSIPVNDTIVLTTARDSRHEEHTLQMLNHFNIRYDKILFDLRAGPRCLINDIKPTGSAGNTKPLNTAHAINVIRNEGIKYGNV